MKKNLQDYISTATDYLGAVSDSDLNSYRDRIMTFCKKHKLEETFLVLVAQNDFWYSLSQKKEVQFFVDTTCIKKSPRTCIAKPSIYLRIFDINSIPVIKICTQSYPF